MPLDPLKKRGPGGEVARGGSGRVGADLVRAGRRRSWSGAGAGAGTVDGAGWVAVWVAGAGVGAGVGSADGWRRSGRRSVGFERSGQRRVKLSLENKGQGFSWLLPEHRPNQTRNS